MQFTLQGAANATGKAKSTIQRAIKTGKLSATRNIDGHYQIDGAELSRVYPLLATGSAPVAMKQDATYNETEALRVQVELLQMQVEIMRETTVDLRHRLDQESSERRKLTAILTYQQNIQVETTEPAPPSRLWEKLFGRGV